MLLGYNFNSIVDLEIIPGIDLQASFAPPDISPINQQAFIQMKKMPILLPLNNAFGTCSYAISPLGAKQLLDSCFPLTGQAVAVPALQRILQPTSDIDVIMNNNYRRLQAFCCLPPLAISPHNLQDSDTSNRNNS